METAIVTESGVVVRLSKTLRSTVQSCSPISDTGANCKALPGIRKVIFKNIVGVDSNKVFMVFVLHPVHT